MSEAAKEANKSINRIRQVVERTTAHIKSWRIHPLWIVLGVVEGLNPWRDEEQCPHPGSAPMSSDDVRSG